MSLHCGIIREWELKGYPVRHYSSLSSLETDNAFLKRKRENINANSYKFIKVKVLEQ